jgi:predicted lipoprotein
MRFFRARFYHLILVLALVTLTLSGCVLATVRTLDEDEEAKAGFSGEDYVSGIWENQVLPAYREQAQDLPTLLNLITTNQQSAIDQYGHRSGTGAYSFMVRGEGKIVTFDTSSQNGLATIDLNPPDGTPDASLVIGPLIKISQRAAVRDAVGFIEYGSFANQQEFADVANAMGARIAAIIAEKLGAANVEAIQQLDPTNFEGKTISFIGAYTLDPSGKVIVVPIEIEVSD